MSTEKKDKSLLDEFDQEFNNFAHTLYPEAEPEQPVEELSPAIEFKAVDERAYDSLPQWMLNEEAKLQVDLFGEAVPVPEVPIELPAVPIGQDIITIRALTGKARKNADEALKAAAVKFLNDASPDCFWVPINVASSKNSKEIGFFWRKNPDTGKNEKVRTLVDSKLTKEYKANTAGYWLQNKVAFLNQTRHLPKPVSIEFTFIRESLRAFDFINACQVIADLMKAHGYFADDDTVHLHPIFNPVVFYNQEMPGVLFRVIK